MKNYEKPIVMINEDTAEGVYAASGCYTVRITGHQTPDTGRQTHKFQFDGDHLTSHMGSAQLLVVTFDKDVTYVSSSGTYVSGTGTNEITISYSYTQNPTDRIGLGDLEVSVADNGALSITGLKLLCNGNGDF